METYEPPVFNPEPFPPLYVYLATVTVKAIQPYKTRWIMIRESEEEARSDLARDTRIEVESVVPVSTEEKHNIPFFEDL
jgi:hypothetical protein